MVCNTLRTVTAMWMRRIALYFIGVTSATGMLVLVTGAFLVASGVLEW